MLEYQANPNDDLFLRIQLDSDATGLYPRAKIYAISDPSTVVDTVDLDELSNGLYGKVWTNNGERKKYFTQTIVYTNSGHTNVHPIIRPDSDSINIGFNASGFSVGGKGNVVQRVGLTKKELKELLQLMVPYFKSLSKEIKTRSTFDPKKTKVKTDIVVPPVDLSGITEPPTPKQITASIKPELAKLAKALKIDYKPPKDGDLTPVLELQNELLETLNEYSNLFIQVHKKIEETAEKYKVEIEKPKDITADLQALGGSVKKLSDKTSKIETDGLKRSAMAEEKEITKSLLKSIEMEDDPFEIYKLWKQVKQKDKVKIFNYLLQKKPKVVKYLQAYAETEKIYRQLKTADDKESVFQFLVNVGKINKTTTKLLKRFAHA